MIKTKEEIKVRPSYNAQGVEKMYLADLADFEGRHPKLDTFSAVSLKVGEEVGFHVHEGEFESYYIISGKGLYLDHDKEVEVLPGTVTYTPSGKGHGIKNIGDETLEFIALVIKN